MYNWYLSINIINDQLLYKFHYFNLNGNNKSANWILEQLRSKIKWLSAHWIREPCVYEVKDRTILYILDILIMECVYI